MENKKYYLSLLGSLLVILTVVGVIYYKNQQYKEIANLNEKIQKEETIANRPQITIHDEEVYVDDIIEEGANDTSIDEDIQEEAIDLPEEIYNEETIMESEIVEVVPVIKINQPNLTFSKEEKIIMPISGEIIIPYNEATPVYLKTLDQYRISRGLYIQGEIGDEVKAVADGVIEEITFEYSRGNTVRIYHGNGFETIYSQLKDDINVKEGDVVERGRIIGYLSEPTDYYKLEGTHLYFELVENDNAINPENYF